MKKLFLAIALAFAAGSIASAQDFVIQGRMDYPISPDIYTYFDGEIGEHVSYSFSNHWATYYKRGDLEFHTKDLYQNTWRSWDVNWCDWANFTFTFGNLSITAGKDLMLSGNSEEVPNDADNYYMLCSQLWNCLQVYQWGGKIAYTFPAINTTFEAQLCSSPLDEKPFSYGGTLSFGLSGEYGIYHPYLTANFIKYDASDFDDSGYAVDDKLCIFTLGNLFEVNDNLSIALNYAFCHNKPVCNTHHIILDSDWRFAEHFALKVKGGYEFGNNLVENILGLPDKSWFAGAMVQFYPLKNDNLRFHAGGCYRTEADQYFNVGISYCFNVTDLFRK